MSLCEGEVWRIDGEATENQDDDSGYEELDDEISDIDNRIGFSENIAINMMETKFLQGAHRCSIVLPFPISVVSLLRFVTRICTVKGEETHNES